MSAGDGPTRHLDNEPAPKNQAQAEEAAIRVCWRVERLAYALASRAREGDLSSAADLLAEIDKQIREAPPIPPLPAPAPRGEAERRSCVRKTRVVAEAIAKALDSEPPDLDEALRLTLLAESNLDGLGARV